MICPAAWTLVLLISTLPNVVLQEVFGTTVDGDSRVILSVGVIAIALVASLACRPLRALYPLLVLFSVLAVGQWLVYSRIDELPFFADRPGNSSFNVYMLAEQLLNLIVALLMICALVLMKKKPRASTWRGASLMPGWSQFAGWAQTRVPAGNRLATG